MFIHIKVLSTNVSLIIKKRFPGVVASVLDWDIKVSLFDLKLRYVFHFRLNTPGKYMNFLISPAMG